MVFKEESCLLSPVNRSPTNGLTDAAQPHEPSATSTTSGVAGGLKVWLTPKNKVSLLAASGEMFGRLPHIRARGIRGDIRDGDLCDTTNGTN